MSKHHSWLMFISHCFPNRDYTMKKAPHIVLDIELWYNHGFEYGNHSVPWYQSIIILPCNTITVVFL